MATSKATVTPGLGASVAPPEHTGPPARPRGRAPSRRRSALLLAAGTALVSGALAWFLSATPLLRLMELKTQDLRFVLRGKLPPPSNIVIVNIDARTEQAIPEPRVLWHPHYADLFRAAAKGGAKNIGVDVFFAMSVEPWLPGADRALAAAFAEVSETVPIVLAYENMEPEQEGLPLYILASAQGAMGFANLTLDRDNFVRRQELQSRDGAGFESFAARLAAMVLKTDAGVVSPNRRTIRFGDRVAPLDSSGFLQIHYWGPAGTFPSVSMADVLEAGKKGDTAQLERWFRGKVVLVGTMDPSDQQSTPFYLASGGQKLMPGVEIQASTLNTILEQRYLHELSPAFVPLLVFAMAILAAFSIFRVPFPIAPLLLLAAGVGYVVVAVLYFRSGWLLPVTPPILSLVVAGLGSYGVYSVSEGRERRLLQDVFGRYVSKELAEELLDYGEIQLGGTEQIATVMFTDIRSYTSYCQGRDPQIVVAELNEYFADMTAEIKAHGGMVNKFIGDGIMALFGAPVPHPDDARRAVACGLHMVRRNEAWNLRRAELGLQPLKIGIGVHTGAAVVGNIGAPEKMEYTAIGDSVNIAARIEGENKTFHSSLLISEATYQIVHDEAVAALAGYAQMKGITEPMALYTVSALKGGESCSLEH